MSRHIYSISDETIEVITDRKAMAFQFGCNVSYVNQVMAGIEPDPMAYMKPWYAAAVRSGQRYGAYDESFAAIRSMSRTGETNACNNDLLCAKVKLDAQTTTDWIEAFADGELDAGERKRLREDLELIRANCDRLEAMLNESFEVRKFAKGEVAKRRAETK